MRIPRNLIRVIATLIVFVASLSAGALPAPPATAAASIRRASEPVPDRYVVVLRVATKDVDAAARELAATHGGRLLAIWKHAIKGFWVEMSEADAKRVALDARVAAIEQDAVVHLSDAGDTPTGLPTPVPPVFDGDTDPLWHLTRISHRGRTAGPGEAALGFNHYRYTNDGSWQENGVTKRVKVYVVDMGMWTQHEELTGATVSEGYNAALKPEVGPYPSPAPVDLHPPTQPCGGVGFAGTNAYHGTTIASLLAGRNTGVAKGVEIVPVQASSCIEASRFLATTALLIGAFDWIREHGQIPGVVNASTYLYTRKDGVFQCGGQFSDVCATGGELTALETAVHNVVEAGFPVFTSANNHAGDACFTSPARLGRRSGRTVGSPPVRTGVITVGGIDRNDGRWDTPTPPDSQNNLGSNYGQCVDLFAPAAQISAAFPVPSTSYVKDRGLISGTSYASPIVAGLAARIMAADHSIWNVSIENRKNIATNVWNALRANASPFAPANVKVASPHLLAYLGAVTFRSQPPDEIVRPEGEVVNLTVGVVEPVTYQWYEGTLPIAGATANTHSVAVTSAHISGREYWVRATSIAHGPAYYSDSRKTKIRKGTCAVPVIVEQPVSLWKERSEITSASQAVLRAAVTADADYNWYWVRPDLAASAPECRPQFSFACVVEHGDDTESPELKLEAAPAADVTTYQLIVKPGASCGTNDWTVFSDTAQIRTCRLPNAPSLTRPINNQFQLQAALHAADSGAKFLWYYSSSGLDGTFAILREGIPLDEVGANGGLMWKTYDSADIRPPKNGWYAARAVTDCGESPLSNTIQVTNACPYFLRGRYPHTEYLGQAGLGARSYAVQEGSRARFDLRPNAQELGIPPILTYDWMPGADLELGRDRKWVTTPPISANETFQATATATYVGGCQETMQFRVTGTAQTCSPIRATIGRCAVRDRQPTFRYPMGTTVTIRAFIEDGESGISIDPARFAASTFRWRKDGSSADLAATPQNPAYLQYTFGAFRERIDLTVTSPEGCTDTTSVYFEPMENVCKTNCVPLCSKSRAVRSLGLEVRKIVFTPGDIVTLSAPEIVQGFTYEWYRGPLHGLGGEMFATTPNVTVQLIDPIEIWVITHDGPEASESEHVEATPVDQTPQGELYVQPAVRTVRADTSTSFTAVYNNRTDLTRYEWRMGADRKLYRPVIGSADTLWVNADNDATFWCRVIEPATPTKPEQIFESNFVQLIVTCSPAVSGHVEHESVRIERNQRPRLVAFGRGLDLVYTWIRTYPDDSTPVIVEDYLPIIQPLFTRPITQFSVSAVDACGTTGSLGMTTVYLCVPTITQQPNGALVAPGTPVTLTVAASPAIDGQPLSVKWYRGNDVNRVTSLGNLASFTPSVAPGTAESFYAAITSDCGGSPNVVTSQTVTVEVCAPPVITSVGQSFWIRPRQNIYLSTNATGKDLTYQWYVGPRGDTSRPITNGGNDPSIIVNPDTTTSYWCRVTSQGLCPADGPTHTLKVCSPPEITAQPSGIRLFPSKTTALSVFADAGSNTEPLAYRWQQMNTSGTWINITDADDSTLTTPPFTVETTYRVVVSAGTCETPSEAVVVSSCAYNEEVPGREHKIGYNESASLDLPNMSPVQNKTITWYRGDVRVRTSPMRTAVGTNLVNPTGSLTQTTLYWAEFEHEGCVSHTSVYTVRVCRPDVTAQPVAMTVANGSPATLTVGVTPIVGQTFQWYAGPTGTITNPVPSGTSASLTVSPAVTTSYWVRVTGPCGLSHDSDAATVTVCNPPSISGVTPTTYIESGNQTTIGVSANGSNLTYQWYVGNRGDTATKLANGLTTGTSSHATVAPTATKKYWCRVTSEGLCSVDGPEVTVDVCTDPTINTEPVSKVAFSGKPVTLSVTASGAGTLSYQWYQGTSGITSSPVAGATSSSFNFNASTDTSYWCRVSTRVCNDDSATASVSLCVYNEIVNAPGADRNTFAGETVTLSFPSMNPVSSKTITWYRGVSGDKSAPPLKSAVATSLSLNVSPEFTTQYWAEFVHNTCVSRTGTYTVHVCNPTITQQPQNTTIQNGTTTTLTVGTTGESLSYQWYVGNPGDVSQPAPGPTATTSSYTTPALTTNTSYWVRVSGCSVAANSNAGVITVCNTPTVTLSKTNESTPGLNGMITATATGTALSYQWYRGQSGDVSQPISGATNSTYGFTLSKSDYYWVRVTTACNGSYTHSAAILYSVRPKITTHPQSATIPYGGFATLSVTATGNFLTYQWYNNSSAIPGATSWKYTTPALNADVDYWCRVSSGSVYVNSNTAEITMCSGPSITSFTISFKSGTTYELYAKVASAHVLDVEYDWYTGVPGDLENSTSLGPGNPKQGFWNVTTPRTVWVRVKFEDGSCYKDTGGITIPQ